MRRSKSEVFKDRLMQIGFSLLVIFLAFTPTWVYLLARFAFSPVFALTEIILFGVALYFLGALQIVFAIIGIICLIAFWEV